MTHRGRTGFQTLRSVATAFLSASSRISRRRRSYVLQNPERGDAVLTCPTIPASVTGSSTTVEGRRPPAIASGHGRLLRRNATSPASLSDGQQLPQRRLKFRDVLDIHLLVLKVVHQSTQIGLVMVDQRGLVVANAAMDSFS